MAVAQATKYMDLSCCVGNESLPEVILDIKLPLYQYTHIGTSFLSNS